MPNKGFKQSNIHRARIAAKAQLRGNNGWFGRKHNKETIEKMRRPKSIEHKVKLSLAAFKRWNKGGIESEWLVMKQSKEVVEPPRPMMYRDIFDMDRYEVVDGILWEDV